MNKTPRLQSTNNLIMVRSQGFRSNIETLSTNFAQLSDKELDIQEIQQKAKDEFNNLVSILRSKNVNITIIDGPKTSPDCIFPNNTFSTHLDFDHNNKRYISTIVFYPMLAKNRQDELTATYQETLKKEFDHVIDLRPYREKGQILEGTGSLVLDRINKIAYASRSPRTNPKLVEKWARKLNYTPVIFDALDSNNNAVYHTNVAMWVGTKIAIICLEAIPNETERKHVEETLKNSGKTVVAISKQQMDAPNFSGNALEILNGNGDQILAMSKAAWNGYTQDQKDLLNITYPAGIIKEPIPTIEQYGGGSLRCMIAEVFTI